MTPDTIMRLIALNVEMEGALRVLAARNSDEALAMARGALAEINALMDAGYDDADAPEAEIPADAPAVEPAAEVPAQPEPVAEPECVTAAEPQTEPEDSPVTVDEMPPRRERPDLRRAFTLNDKFLFRRELFADSDAEFGDTIDLLMTMDSLDEAREYLLHDLQWDPDNTVVADFLAIVTNHFSQRGR